MNLKSRIIIFSKAPLEGEVKTRMIPELGAKGAAQLHRRLLESTVEMACSSNLAEVELHCAPDSRHAFFRQLQNRYPVRLRTQQGKDLGERMFQAIYQSLQSRQRVVLIGTDCPPLNRLHLQTALGSLSHDSPLSIAPAQDGGYVLIAASAIHPRVFQGINWGSEQVYAQTCQAINQLGWQHNRLDTLWDLDRPQDLQKLSPQQQQYYLRTTTYTEVLI